MSKPIFEDFLSFNRGRRNRKSLLLLILAQSAAATLLLGAVLFIAPHLGPQGQAVLGLLLLAASLPLILSQVAATTQRCRDLDHSGWLVVLNMIPFVAIAFQLYLFLAPGTAGENRFGPDPREPSRKD